VILFSLGAALAATPADMPLMATAACPGQGLCRIEVPAAMVAADVDDWLLLDEGGEAIPYAVLRSGADPGPDARETTARFAPPGVLEVDRPDGHPISALTVRFARGSFRAKAHVETWREGGVAWQAGPEVDISGGVFLRRGRGHLPTPDPGADRFRVVIDQDWTELPGPVKVTALALAPEILPYGRAPATLTGTDPGEGETLYAFELPGPARVEALEIAVEGDVFDRRAEAITWRAAEEALGSEPLAQGRLTRVLMGDTRVDRARLEGLNASTDRLAVKVRDGRDAPLAVTGAVALIERRVLLVRDAGESTLYGGAPLTLPEHDLQTAAEELARQDAVSAEVGEAVYNPAWLGSVEAEVLAPGAPVSLDRFLWVREVAGEGVSRIPLPQEVRAATHQGMADLRLITSEGLQLPYVLDLGAESTRLDGVSQILVELTGMTRLRVVLPDSGVPIHGVVLRTSARGFSRKVDLFETRGDAPRRIRQLTWEGAERGESRLVIRLDRAVGAQLLIEIENGDDAPLPLDPVEVTSTQLYLLAKLPLGGARLVYGDAAAGNDNLRVGPLGRVGATPEPIVAPRYDARRLAPRLRSLPATRAIPGPPEPVQIAVSDEERWLINGALLILVAGLVWLMLRLLRSLSINEENA
jgi:hypothetical protein